eukprot:UN08961
MIIQAEAFFKAAISLIPSLPATFSTQYTNTIQSTPALLAQYIQSFSSTLLLMPGHPSKGAFYLMEELMLALEKWSPWSKEKAVTIEKCQAYLSMFTIFTTFSQRKFPYNIKNVSSNDQLYGRRKEYLSKCVKIVNRFGKQIHKQLNELKQSHRNLDKQAAGLLGLKFMNILVDFIKIDHKSIKIISVVHEIVIESKNLDKKYYRNTMDHIQIKNDMLYTQLKQQQQENE